VVVKLIGLVAKAKNSKADAVDAVTAATALQILPELGSVVGWITLSISALQASKQASNKK
jgi:hypothetical protein